MNALLLPHLEYLKKALITLDPTGEHGFEGLIGVMLRELTGVPFRLAQSGSQRGIDGASVDTDSGICFEGKLYTGPIAREKLITKIADAARENLHPDLLWVLGATTQVSTQIARDLENDGRGHGITVLILDWAEMQMPSLAVALAAGGQAVEDFLAIQVADATCLQNVKIALDAVRNDGSFEHEVNRIKALLMTPSAGSAFATIENVRWMAEAFANRQSARVCFGQTIAPNDMRGIKLLPRAVLVKKTQTALSCDKVTFVVGDEGCGKSWVVAQSWLGLQQKPLFVFLGAECFQNVPITTGELRTLLINKLIDQTNDTPSDFNRERWQKRFARWKNTAAANMHRIIVVIDGINQRPQVDWGRVVDTMAHELKKISGCLIVTSRIAYYRESATRSASYGKTLIHVGEWSADERNEILEHCGIDAATLNDSVAASLSNPRLLGIALELFSKQDITSFGELSVSRLLFEHIRISDREGILPQSAKVFSGTLKKSAIAVIERVKKQERDDIKIFSNDLIAVADGRFFQELAGEPDKYEIKEEGLRLALGIAIVAHLRTALRNQTVALDESLQSLLEPIAALDKVASVIMAALTVISIDEADYDADVARCLINGFAVLQNPDESLFPEFTAIVQRHPSDFMQALRAMCLSGAHQTNFDWMRLTMLALGREPELWPAIAEKISEWLATHSLKILGLVSTVAPDGSGEKAEKERVELQEKLDAKISALSPFERQLQTGLSIVDDNVNELSRLAFYILAGKPLAGFADALLEWSFGNALNSSPWAPLDEFRQLIRFNICDWQATRDALVTASEPFWANDTSQVGKWALVAILYATGDRTDAAQAKPLVDDLTKDRTHIKSWSRNNFYCSTDPCDPLSIKPENIENTAINYSNIDVSKLNQTLYRGKEGLFFDEARLGLARFRPDVAIAKHQELAIHVLNRKGYPLRQGLFEIHEHNALWDKKYAEALVEKRSLAKDIGALDGLNERDAWIIMQYYLLVAFPHLDPTARVKALLSIDENEHVLLNVLDAVKSLSSAEFDALLEDACIDGNRHKQYLLLEVAIATGLPLSTRMRDFIKTNIDSDFERLRRAALQSVVEYKDFELLEFFAESNWSSKPQDENQDFENWFGSIALIEAAALKLIDDDSVWDRIFPRAYGYAASKLGRFACARIAKRLDILFQRLISENVSQYFFPVERKSKGPTFYGPSTYKIQEDAELVLDGSEKMKAKLEDWNDFEKKQKRDCSNFERFRDGLFQTQIDFILHEMEYAQFSAIVSSDAGLADKWYGLFMKQPKEKVAFLHNYILMLAHIYAQVDSNKSQNLLGKLQNSRPLVRVIYPVDVDLEAMTIWNGANCEILDKERRRRLDAAQSDYGLSIEVLAALSNGKEDFLIDYIESKISKVEPSNILRGIMVAGFMDESPKVERIISSFSDSHGFFGSAWRAAKYAYERNQWARVWYERMCATESPTEFWRAQVLFTKIVDGRFTLWREQYQRTGTAIQNFWNSVDSKVKHRIERWKRSRSDKLFGDKIPQVIFLTHC